MIRHALSAADHARGSPSMSRRRDPAWQSGVPEPPWLSPDPTLPAARGRMRTALAEALAAMDPAVMARVATLADADHPGAALRLTARLLHGAYAGRRARDLATCALLLAVIEYRDVRAAIELILLHGAATRPARQEEAACRRCHVDHALALLARAGRGWWCAVEEAALLSETDPLTPEACAAWNTAR